MFDKSTNKKGETVGCLLGMSAAGVFTIGLFICVISRFLCTELDFTEEQRNLCEIKAFFVLLFGFLLMIGSTFVMMFSARILGVFSDSSAKVE